MLNTCCCSFDTVG